MKSLKNVIKKIKRLSDVVGLPVKYSSDLDVIYELLKDYKGSEFLLILRLNGAQLCLLENQDDEYRLIKFQEFGFYFSQRDAQFYYYNGNDIKAISPILALEMIAADKMFDDDEEYSQLQENYKSTFKRVSKYVIDDIHYKAHIDITWTIDDIKELVSEKEYKFTPELTNYDYLKVLNLLENSHDANVGITWSVIDNALRQLYSNRLNKNNLPKLEK